MIGMDPRLSRWCSRACVCAALTLVSCGSRSSLSPGSAAQGGGAGAGGAVVSSSSAGGSGGQPGCLAADVLTWSAEHHRDDGDYERATVATSGVPWVALKVRDGNVVVRQLGVDEQAGILVLDSFEIPDSPVYPVALDVSDTRFVLLTTTGINWNGDVELWSVDRASGAVLHAPVGEPPIDPAYTIGSAIGLLGDDVAIAYSRLIDDQGTIEIRDAALQVVTSTPVDGVSFNAVRRSPSALDIYAGANLRVHIEAGAITTEPTEPGWTAMGGLKDYLVQYGDQIRMTHGDQVWSGPWPHSQISPPAVVREHGGRAVFSLETELTGVVGYPSGGELHWMPIEPAPDAPGIGLALLPVLGEGRMGLFYLGLEIPQPEQPLRYFGRVCH